MSEPVIEVRHLSKSFGTHVVLRDVDFTVNAGDVTCIIGASGSGKSTLLRCINLLETPTNGKVLFHGNDITAKGSDPCAYRAKVGMVFQSFNLIDELNVYENVELPLTYLGVKAGERKRMVDDILKRMNISHRAKHFPQQLSGGQQQRVAIARALVSKPAIVLADEPTGNLDSMTSSDVLSLLKVTSTKFHQTLVMITHNNEIAQLADRIIRIEDGKIVQ